MKNKIHTLKIEPQYSSKIKQGIKTCEIRENDRDYQVNDILILKSFSQGVFCKGVKDILVKVTNIDNFRQKDNTVVLSFKLLDKIEFIDRVALIDQILEYYAIMGLSDKEVLDSPMLNIIKNQPYIKDLSC